MRNILVVLNQNKRTVLFLLLYTVFFCLYVRFFIFLLPLTLGLFLAAMGAPLCRLFKKTFRFGIKVSARFVSAALAILLFLILGISILIIIKEITYIQSQADLFHFSNLHPKVQFLFEKAYSSIKNYIREGKFTSAAPSLLLSVPTIIKRLLSVPSFFILLILSFLFCCFFLQSSDKIHLLLTKFFGYKNYEKLKAVLKQRTKKSTGFFLSYAIIYSITFTETLIILHLLKIRYPVITAVTVTVSDIFPVLGPGIILIPISIYKFLCGDFVQAIGLLVGWILITSIRQVIEQKLISNITKTPGLIMWLAVYISLITNNFWFIPYTALLFFLYPFLRELSEYNKKTPSEQQ